MNWLPESTLEAEDRRELIDMSISPQTPLNYYYYYWCRLFLGRENRCRLNKNSKLMKSDEDRIMGRRADLK